jgi:hypothetical protein
MLIFDEHFLRLNLPEKYDVVVEYPLDGKYTTFRVIQYGPPFLQYHFSIVNHEAEKASIGTTSYIDMYLQQAIARFESHILELQSYSNSDSI